MTSQFALFDIAPSLEGVDLRKVEASYSADRIAISGTVKKPVLHGGALWVCVGTSGTRDKRVQKVYQLQLLRDFRGDPTTYFEKSGYWREGDLYPGDFARNDPNGFYHGMAVKSGGEKYVMVGPEQQIDCAPYEPSAPIDDEDDEEIVDDLDGDDLEDGEGGGIYDDDADGGRTRIGNTPRCDEDEDAAQFCEYCDGEVTADGDCVAGCDGWRIAADTICAECGADLSDANSCQTYKGLLCDGCFPIHFPLPMIEYFGANLLIPPSDAPESPAQPSLF